MEKQAQKFTVSILDSTTWRLRFIAGNKSPSGQEKKKKKGDTKIVDPVIRNYTLFWHFALSGIKNTAFIWRHWYGKQFLQPNYCILLKQLKQ